MWHFKEIGTGKPIILLHGIGMTHAAWNAVIPYLSSTRHVIAFDIAGFGQSPPLAQGTPPTIANLVDALECSLREMDVEFPVDIAGNSLGGYLSLEAARRGMAGSIVAISPAGLWRKHPPAHVKSVFRTIRFVAKNFTGFTRACMHSALLRELLLALPLSVGSRRMPVQDALHTVEDLASSSAFEETFHHTRAPFSGGNFASRVTVAFGNRDWILPKRSRYLDRLPAHSRCLEKPRWGHVPMWVDPVGVSKLILQGTDR